MENYERGDIYAGMLSNPPPEGIPVRSSPGVEGPTEIPPTPAATGGAALLEA